MPVPKRQHSRSRRGKRVGGKSKVLTMPGFCLTCKAVSEQHSVCLSCGYYRGMKVLRSKDERLEERKVVKKIKERSLEESVARKNMVAESSAKQAIMNEQEKTDKD